MKDTNLMILITLSVDTSWIIIHYPVRRTIIEKSIATLAWSDKNDPNLLCIAHQMQQTILLS